MCSILQCLSGRRHLTKKKKRKTQKRKREREKNSRNGKQNDTWKNVICCDVKLCATTHRRVQHGGNPGAVSEKIDSMKFSQSMVYFEMTGPVLFLRSRSAYVQYIPDVPLPLHVLDWNRGNIVEMSLGLNWTHHFMESGLIPLAHWTQWNHFFRL